MRYSGLSLGESDICWQLAHSTIESITKTLTRGLKVRENEYNTSGPENVAMVLDELILDKSKIETEFHKNSNFINLVLKTLEALRRTILLAESSEDWGEERKQIRIRESI
jgi:hypothetical protein